MNKLREDIFTIAAKINKSWWDGITSAKKENKPLDTAEIIYRNSLMNEDINKALTSFNDRNKQSEAKKHGRLFNF